MALGVGRVGRSGAVSMRERLFLEEYFTCVYYLLLYFVATAAMCTRGMSIGKAIISAGNSTVVNTDIGILGGSSINAVASLSKGFALSIPRSTAGLRVDFMKVGSIITAIGPNGRLGIILRRSGRALSRIMIMKCKASHHKSLANTVSSIDRGILGSVPVASTTTTVAKGLTNIGMITASKSPSTAVRVAMHNNNSVARSGSPLCVISNFRIDGVGSVPPNSVRDVSILGSTSSATVCKTGNTGNIVLIAAGDNGTKGARVSFGTR